MIGVSITVGLALATMGVGFRAAWLWLCASRVGSGTNAPVDEVRVHIVDMQGQAAESATLNGRAAEWTAVAAGLGAVTTGWSVLSPFLHI
jgi:hypothetical protein